MFGMAKIEPLSKKQKVVKNFDEVIRSLNECTNVLLKYGNEGGCL